MDERRSHGHSTYLEWAKLKSQARHNLAISGMFSIELDALGVAAPKIDINGPGGYGYAPLLEAIAERYRVGQESVVAAFGTSMANYLALAVSTEPGDEVLFEQPGYEPLVSTARYLGLRASYFQRRAQDRFQIDLAELASRVSERTRAIVITDFHNPSGAACSTDTLSELAALAREHELFVIVDEVYREMLYEAEPQSAFHIDPARFIITNSLTKGYGLSGLRCGWVLAAPDLVHRMWRINDLHGATFVHPGELLSVVAFENLPRIAAQMSATLASNRQLLRRFLDDRRELEYHWPEHGTVVFPRLRSGNADQLCVFLQTQFEVSIVPGRFFGAPEHFRIGVGAETPVVAAALRQLSEGMDAFARSGTDVSANLDRSAAAG